MKKLILAAILILCSVAMFAQTHTVERGESLQSIAAKYQTTIEKLVEANPGIDKLFYVGLKLNIPEATAAVKADSTEPVQQSATNNSVVMADEPANLTEETDNAPGLSFVLMLEYGFLPKNKGASGTNYTYTATVGINYWIMRINKGLFAGARIGYNSANYNSYTKGGRGEYLTQTSTAHFITLPINIGYALSSANNFLAVTPYAGLDVNFCVAGKNKVKGNIRGESVDAQNEFDKKTGLDARLGIILRIGGFNIGGSYVIPLNKYQKSYFGKDAYFAINMGFGF